MAKARKKVPAENTRVVTFDGVNHLLVQTTTGELAEYPTLANKAIDQRIAKTAAEWLGQVLKNVNYLRARQIVWPTSPYSYRNASIGSRRDALIAGSSPATRPTNIRIPVQMASSSNDSIR